MRLCVSGIRRVLLLGDCVAFGGLLSACDSGTPPATVGLPPAVTSNVTTQPRPPEATIALTPIAPSTQAAGSNPTLALRDITYCTGGGVALKMDVQLPQNPLASPAPAILFVHGGGWQQGTRTQGGLVSFLTPELVKRGYVVAAADYRLAPAYRFPAQIEDVKCAVRYLRASAALYNLDPTRIGVWGDSAGGHLAALLGLTNARAHFDGSGGYADQPSTVQVVVDMFGPSDLTKALLPNNLAVPNLKKVFNVLDLLRASPVTYVTKAAPPFLIIQGDKDGTVPLSQSQELYAKLKAAGAPATFLVVANAGHEFAPIGGSITPTKAQIVQDVANFFDTHL